MSSRSTRRCPGFSWKSRIACRSAAMTCSRSGAATRPMNAAFQVSAREFVVAICSLAPSISLRSYDPSKTTGLVLLRDPTGDLGVLRSAGQSVRSARPHLDGAASETVERADLLGELHSDAHVLEHQAQSEPGVERLGHHEVRPLLLCRPAATARAVEDVQHDRRVQPEP